MSRKISVDLSDENFEALDKFRESRNMPYSIIINRLLRILCKSPDIKDELITICKSRIRALYAEMDQVGIFECQKLYNKSAQYIEILSFLTQNPQITVSSILDEAQMKKIRLVDGYLIYPENFILLNESAAQNYRNVCIVEIRNAQFPVPHFIYFSGNNPAHYTDADTTYINPIYDPDNPMRCINDAEMRTAPQIGYFGIIATNDPNYSDLYAAPYNIKIIRD